MDSFENLVAMLLKREGYWTMTSVKVELTKAQKRRIGRHSSPRWELDVVAYKGGTNELLVVECKSFLDSRGVCFCSGHFDPPSRYKLFENRRLRGVVLRRLVKQLVRRRACAPNPQVRLGLAIGKVGARTNLAELRAHFGEQGWMLYLPDDIRDRLERTSKGAYENDIACVVSKLLLRRSGKKAAD